MGFSKFANAAVVDPAINRAGWDEIRQAAVGLGPSFESRKAAQVVLEQYDPSRYLLSHCSIIASVDTEQPGQPLGVQMFDGVQINRKYGDYFISVGTSKYVNNNNDAWERKLLLAAYKTFIGGENYVEHIQIPELSKGKIIDAAARDIGDSIYVDILVATDKKHKPLIDAISSGQLSTLSMGCHVAFTICTKCGNVAEDELQLCRHIKYQKGNWFIDAMGKRRKIAELCGHIDAEPGSVKFIEGSWVANPAFTGAVLRNILDPSTAQMADQVRRKIQIAFSEPARTADPNMLQKAARLAPVGLGQKAIRADHLPLLFDGPPVGELHATKPFSTQAKAEENLARRRAEISQAQSPEAIARREAEAHQAFLQIQAQGQQQAFPGEGDMGGGGQQQAPAAEEDPLKGIADELYKTLRKKVEERIRADIEKDEAGNVRQVLDENKSNESLIKSALRYPKWQERAKVVMAAVKTPSTARSILAGLILHDMGGWEAVGRAKRFTGREILVMARLIDRLTKKSSMAGDSRIYTTVIAVGGTGAHANVNAYLTACRRVLGRALLESEKAQLIEKGKLFSIGL